MQVVLPEQALPAKLILNPDAPLNDDEYYAFCVANADLRFERAESGEILIVPPAGGEADFQCVVVVSQLDRWAERDGRGTAFGSSIEFILPTRAALSPDAAWVSNERLSQLSKQQLRRFPPVCPEFIIEVMSPSDRLKTAKKKMETWIRGGVELAWLIHGDEKTIYVYRAGREGFDALAGITKLQGEGSVAGFELDLRRIWAGL